MMINVLIADDHAIVRAGLRALLSAQPDIAVVGDAANGLEAVHQVQEKHPDIILLDIAMPVLNGLEAAQEIEASCPETAVIVVSMHSSSEYIRLALLAGVRGYLLKETIGAEVVDAVRLVHDGQSYFSRQVVDRLGG
jgi:DNA-binding NarL/FixJ family response regulator